MRENHWILVVAYPTMKCVFSIDSLTDGTSFGADAQSVREVSVKVHEVCEA